MKYYFLALTILFLTPVCMNAQNTFAVQPYLQIGSDPSPNAMHILWQTSDSLAQYVAEYQTPSMKTWKKADSLFSFINTVSAASPRRSYNAIFNHLEPGGTFRYHVLRNGKEVFSSTGKALKNQDQPYRFLAVGDLGAGTPEAKQISGVILKQNPDVVMVSGDIVYDYGLSGEYDQKFWPIYNADKPDSVGNPILRTIPWVAAPGNHDTETRDLDKYPDALAYFYFWDQPRNGPAGSEGVTYPVLKGSEARKSAFIAAAGKDYPKMSNYSFNYGNAHWLVLDANPSVDWTNKELTDWVAKDLAASSGSTWRFVLFHHPGFNSAHEHFEQQQMRLLAPLFEAGKVDIVFNGHVHNYQRSFPLTFSPVNKGVLLMGGKDNKTVRGRVVVGGWKLDRSFDGTKLKNPSGVIYLVTGAGGQELYNPEQEADPDSWQKFTDKFISTIHSVTVADVDGRKLTIRQVSAKGEVLDEFSIEK